MAADVLHTADAAHDPADAAAALEGYAAEIAEAGPEHAVHWNLTLLNEALHKAEGRPDAWTVRFPASKQRRRADVHDDLVAAFTELGVTTLTEQQRLQLARDLIGTVTGRSNAPRDRARAAGRESILDSFELLDSMDVASILSPTSEPTRSVAQKRRKASELIGLPVGSRPDYRYPAFQLDRAQHCIIRLVKHANKRLDVENDPYGAASWWLTATDILDGRSPLEDLEAGDLTEIAINNVLAVSRRGM